MQALIKNNNVIVYPYSLEQLKLDNVDTSFPVTMPDEQLKTWGVFTVKATAKPEVTDVTRVEESLPVLVDDDWHQVWNIIELTAEQIEQRQIDKKVELDNLRSEAYRNESDPIFFKAQRGEATIQDWLDKVASIKARF